MRGRAHHGAYRGPYRFADCDADCDANCDAYYIPHPNSYLGSYTRTDQTTYCIPDEAANCRVCFSYQIPHSYAYRIPNHIL